MNLCGILISILYVAFGLSILAPYIIDERRKKKMLDISDFIWEFKNGNRVNLADLKEEHKVTLEWGNTKETDFYVWLRILELRKILKPISSEGGKKLHENY